MANEMVEGNNDPKPHLPGPKEADSFQVDPIVFKHKGNQIVNGNILDLVPDTLLNVRHRAGSEFLGIKIEKDTLDIPSMIQQIVDGPGIREPIWVSKRVAADGTVTMVPVRGNRRTFAGQEIAKNPEKYGKDLVKLLTEKTPMIVLTNLTPAQEQEMINDQTQKAFNRSEVIRQVFQLIAAGWSFRRIAIAYWEQFARITRDGVSKAADIRDLSDQKAKEEKILSWLRGTVDNYLVWGYNLGPAVRKAIMLSEMRLDGSVGKDKPEYTPYFLTNKNSQKRIQALREAKEKDGDKWTGAMFDPESYFGKQAKEFHDEDFGQVTVEGGEAAAATNAPPKPLDKKGMAALKESAASRIVKMTLARVLGEPTPDFQDQDTAISIYEAKLTLVNRFLPRLKPEYADLMKTLFIDGDPMNVATLLETMSKPVVAEATVEPTVEAPKVEEPKVEAPVATEKKKK